VEIYSQVFPYINGLLLSEATSVETDLKANIQEISTIVKEVAGFTPSPIMREISVDSVVPRGGIEVDIEGFFIRRQFVKLKLLQGGGQIYESDVFFTSVKISSGVGKTTTVSFSCIGEAKAFA
jgi:hypothetical protein